jgi:hypothetical protein
MEMADKRNRHEITVDQDVVAFVEVPSNLKQFFTMVHPKPFSFLDVVLVFLRTGTSVVGHRFTQHPKFDSPMVVVLAGQTLHETGFVFGTHH